MTRIIEQNFTRPKTRTVSTKPVSERRVITRSPDSWVRIGELARTPSNPGSLLPVSPATLWRWVKAGRFPAPVRLSDSVTAWRWADVQAWLEQQAAA